MPPIKTICLFLALVAGPVTLIKAQNQPESVRQAPLSPAAKDSLVRAYRTLQKQMNRLRRIDEYHDNKDRPIRYNLVKIDLPNWCFGEPNLGYERKLGHHATVMLHAAYMSRTFEQDTSADSDLVTAISRFAFYPGQFTDRDYTTRSRVIRLMPEVRAYLGKNAPRGFFLGAYYCFRRIEWNVERTFQKDGVEAKASGNSRSIQHGLGGVLGFQSIVQSRVSLGFELGLALLNGRKSSSSDLAFSPAGQEGPAKAPMPNILPIAPRLNFQVGFCFGR